MIQTNDTSLKAESISPPSTAATHWIGIDEGKLSDSWIPPQRSSKSPTVSVIIPTLNEAKNLPHVLPKIPSWVNEIIIVDGNSKDGTVEVALKLRPEVRVITESRRGKGTALTTGFAAATGDIIVMLDADASMDPREIYGYVGLLMAGADFVKGSRFIQGGGTSDMTIERKIANYGFVWAVRMLYGSTFSDLCYGYIAFWKHVLPSLDLDADGFEIETLMNIRALQAKLKVAELPSFEHLRMYGKSNLRAVPDGLRVLRTIFNERFKATKSPKSVKFALEATKKI